MIFMKLSLIISYYKNIPALELILQALSLQSFKDFEVIISEDDNNQNTLTYINGLGKQFSFPIHHLHQLNDNGFRKNEMLNKSIRLAKGELLVFIDGDCIPNKNFLSAYVKNLGDKKLCFGRRVMLDSITTQNLYNSKDLTKLNFIKLLFTKTEKLKYSLSIPFMKKFKKEGIWGCNYGIYKKYLIEINGFDEDYVTAGVGEDVDLEWRLRAMNIKFQSIRHEALQYHLHHKENYNRDAVETGLAQLKIKQKANLISCINGLTKVG
jgi:cellulose synthase/poly-beta-1,6-N-acetylglucosamine synthase-like glycosyltransferase